MERHRRGGIDSASDYYVGDESDDREADLISNKEVFEKNVCKLVQALQSLPHLQLLNPRTDRKVGVGSFTLFLTGEHNDTNTQAINTAIQSVVRDATFKLDRQGTNQYALQIDGLSLSKYVENDCWLRFQRPAFLAVFIFFLLYLLLVFIPWLIVNH